MITKTELNAFYQDMEYRANRIFGQVTTLRSKPAELRYYSGHYTKNDSGDYQMDYFPILVLSIQSLCYLSKGCAILSFIPIKFKLRLKSRKVRFINSISRHSIRIHLKCMA